jgi:hypothetical protein
LSFKGTAKCPECSKHLIDMGPKFKAPRRTQLNQWRKVAMMIAFGYRRGVPKRRGCKCEYCSNFFTNTLRVYKPRTLSDAKNQVHLRRNRTKVYA